MRGKGYGLYIYLRLPVLSEAGIYIVFVLPVCLQWRSQGVQWMHLHPRAEKALFRRNLQRKVVSAPHGRARVNFVGHFCWTSEIWRVGVVHVGDFSLCFEGDD